MDEQAYQQARTKYMRNIFILQVFIFNELIFQINMSQAIPSTKKDCA